MSDDSIPAIDRVAGISRQEFLDQYGLPGKPVVIEGKAQAWPALERWTLDFFRQRYGQLPVKVYRSGDIEQSKIVPMGEYLDSFGEEPEASPWYLAAWEFGKDCPELRNDYTTPEYFPHNWFEGVPKKFRREEWLWLFIGPAGSYSPLHIDVMLSSAWNVVVSGAKSWLFFSPEQEAYLYNGAVNAFAPDLEVHPLFARARPLRAVTRPGEILYTPSGWWHQVKNLEPCVAITGNFCDETNYLEVMAYLRQSDPANYFTILEHLLQAREESQAAQA